MVYGCVTQWHLLGAGAVSGCYQLGDISSLITLICYHPESDITTLAVLEVHRRPPRESLPVTYAIGGLQKLLLSNQGAAKVV